MKVVAWARRWHIDGEIPMKVLGRWPHKFKFKAVTAEKLFADDVPLYAEPSASSALAQGLPTVSPLRQGAEPNETEQAASLKTHPLAG